DLLVRRHEVVAAHVAGAGDSCRDHDDVGPGAFLITGRANRVRLIAEHGARLVDVQRLAGGEPLLDVDEHDVGVVAARELLRAGGADVPRADDRHLAPPAHTRTPSFSMTASATWL